MLWSNKAREPLLSRASQAGASAAPWRPCSTAGEATAVSSPHAAAREQPLLTAAEQRPCGKEDPAQPKINKLIKLSKKVKKERIWISI